MNQTLLTIKNLTIRSGAITLLDDISLQVKKGHTLGILGESGSGKSMTALAVLGLLPEGVWVTDGSINFAGQNLLALNSRKMNALRGRGIAMIFQDPRSAFNPVHTIGRQMDEALRAHFSEKRSERLERARYFLKEAGLSERTRILSSYPHQLSGGMLQRVLIGMALSLEPKLVIADEPTTALDALIRVQILELLEKIKQKSGMTLMIISHNLGVIARLADEALVMYGGRMAEYAPINNILNSPLHPYTRALLRARPVLGKDHGRLQAIPGTPPRAGIYEERCKFEPRCDQSMPRCAVRVPGLSNMENGKVACFLYEDKPK